MNEITSLFILVVASAASTFFLTSVLIKLLPKYGVVDAPSARRLHKKETPRGGGIAFVAVFSTLLPMFEYFTFGRFDYSYILLQILLPISLVSFWDDIISHVMIPIRLLIHILCSFLAIMWLIHPNIIFHYAIPIYLDLTIAALSLLTFLNLYNFLDGIDGITVSETAHLSVTIMILCFLNYDIILNVDMIIITSTIIFGWAVGFAYFNWQPAKIFVGDVGSISIGFLLGICLLSVAATSSSLLIACGIMSLYYIADGGLTIFIRATKGEKIWEPHLQHFFQISVRKGRSHKQVVKRIITCNLLLMICSVTSLYYPIIAVIGALIIVAITLLRLVV